MNIRTATWSDQPKIDELHKKYFNHLQYPQFLNKDKFKCPFVVHEDDKIILAGGVQTLAEAVVVTDQSLPVRVRQEALLQAMGSTVHIALALGFKEVYAFVANDEHYVKHLQKFGFKLMDAKLLVLDLGVANGQT